MTRPASPASPPALSSALPQPPCHSTGEARASYCPHCARCSSSSSLQGLPLPSGHSRCPWFLGQKPPLTTPLSSFTLLRNTYPHWTSTYSLLTVRLSPLGCNFHRYRVFLLRTKQTDILKTNEVARYSVRAQCEAEQTPMRTVDNPVTLLICAMSFFVTDPSFSFLRTTLLKIQREGKFLFVGEMRREITNLLLLNTNYVSGAVPPLEVRMVTGKLSDLCSLCWGGGVWGTDGTINKNTYKWTR